MALYSLNGDERLKSRKSIERLFRTGRSISSPPFRLIYQLSENGVSPACMTVAVPKRLVKKAVDRNLLKRRCREAYRIKKPELYKSLSAKNKTVELIFLYQSSEIMDYRSIKTSVNFLLIRLIKELER